MEKKERKREREREREWVKEMFECLTHLDYLSLYINVVCLSLFVSVCLPTSPLVGTCVYRLHTCLVVSWWIFISVLKSFLNTSQLRPLFVRFRSFQTQAIFGSKLMWTESFHLTSGTHSIRTPQHLDRESPSMTTRSGLHVLCSLECDLDTIRIMWYPSPTGFWPCLKVQSSCKM